MVRNRHAYYKILVIGIAVSFNFTSLCITITGNFPNIRSTPIKKLPHTYQAGAINLDIFYSVIILILALWSGVIPKLRNSSGLSSFGNIKNKAPICIGAFLIFGVLYSVDRYAPNALWHSIKISLILLGYIVISVFVGLMVFLFSPYFKPLGVSLE